MNDPLAFLLTFHTYGTWLHGREGGSVDSDHRTYGQAFLESDPEREKRSRSGLKYPPIHLSDAQQAAIVESIRETCSYRSWRLLAVHVRTNHVHVVVGAPESKPEKVLNDLKAYATRRLRRDELLAQDAPLWTEHGSTRYLWTEEAVSEKVHYTLNEQGKPMARWPDLSEHEA